ncbi:tetratricopeptide (TPR) repeat protein [Runella defluvii]|uniref:Tetratricopeptide (TPR) repeat protein n=1 Tax=Runella defluvii TaxID=370973 RepID=A0A7W6ET78_9BACT|nr:tetratricopeptide repeat protein [Runella defluvii]MBB3841530.1 tetratricopeptide (TPR) repeat protein [Runella defluvii]
MLYRILLVIALYWIAGGGVMKLHGQEVFSASEKRVRYLIDFSFQFGADAQVSRYKSELDSIQKVAKDERDERSLAYLDFLKLRLSEEIAPTKEEKNGYTKKLEKITQTTPYDDLKAYSFFWRGWVAFNKKDYTTGLPLLFKARKLLEETYFGKFPHSIYYYIGFFAIYYFFEDYKMAALHCQIALKEPPNAVFSPMGIYNNLGLCYLKMKQYEKAEKAFREGVVAAKVEKNSNYEVLIRGNLGNLLRMMGKYKEALPYLYEEAKVNEKAIPENAAISRLYIANALLMLDSVDKAKPYIAPAAVVMPYWTYPTYDLIRFETLALYHAKMKNFSLANTFKDSLLALKDTLKVKLDYKKVVVLESSLQAEKYINERRALQVEVTNERMLRNVIIFGLIVVFLGVVYWLNERQKQEKRLQTEKRQRAEEMLDHANRQLEQYLVNIKEKNELIETISTQLERNNQRPEMNFEVEKTLENLQQSVLLTEDDWQNFKALYEQVFPYFFLDLNKKYPDLTAAEVRLCALDKLNLTDKVKGTMLGISADSVKKTRYRLRKKYPSMMEEIA